MNIGLMLRNHRRQKGLTLKAVAEKAGVSEGFMSQVENNVKSPSVATLMKICEALQEDMGRLLERFKEQDRLFVVRRGEWDEVELPHTGFATRRFSPPQQRETIDSAMLFISPGKSIPVRKDVRNGQEVLCVLRGSLHLQHGNESVTLTAGDAAHFWAEPEEQAISNRGDELAVVMWVGTL